MGVKPFQNGMKLWRPLRMVELKENGESFYNMNFVKFL
jgi:hypothetical protein